MTINELINEAYQRIEMGEIEESLKILFNIEQLEINEVDKAYLSSGLYIDIGYIKKNYNLINKGIKLLEKHLEVLKLRGELYQSVFYNLGNGYISLYNLNKLDNSYYGFMNKSTELNKAMEYYKESLESKIKDDNIVVQTYVNFANALDLTGRSIEAIEFYDKALSINPNYGMGIANKGIAIKYYSRLMNDKRSDYIMKGYMLIEEGVKRGVDEYSKKVFVRYMKEIEDQVDITSYEYKCNNELENIYEDLTDRKEDIYKKFCIENNIYLNLCDNCTKCTYSIHDNIEIRKMITSVDTPIHESSYIRLSSFLNEIKQNFVAARFLLFEGYFQDGKLDYVDENVLIVNTLNYVENNVYIQLLKFAFKNMYDILDKIAIFINEYLQLGKNEKRVDFNNVWYENGDRSKQKIHNRIIATKNFDINELFNISLGLSSDIEYKELREIRHALTHRYLNIYWMGENSIENMSKECLLENAIKITKIVKNSIIYLMSFIDLEEEKKLNNIECHIPTIQTSYIDDELKNI